MRSVSVVLPESMWAEMPMLRMLRSSCSESSFSAGSALNDLCKALHTLGLQLVGEQ